MAPVAKNDDDEEVLRAAALARRDRRGSYNDHPRPPHSRRGDRDDDQDGDDLARHGARAHGSRWPTSGSVRRERTRSPRRRDAYDDGHGRRHDVVMEEPPVDSMLPSEVEAPPGLSVEDLRALLSEQAALLRVELRQYVDDVARPVLAESAALRDWSARAEAILARIEATQQPPSIEASSTPPTATELLATVVDTPTTTAPPLLEPFDGPADDGLSNAAIDGTAARLELLQLGLGNEVWHDHTDVSDADRPAGGFADSQPALVTTPPSSKKKGRPSKPLPSPRRSGRLAVKRKTRLAADSTVAVQELIARVVGILAPSASFDEVSWDAYQQVFKHAPLASSAIQALEALVKHIKKLKKKGPAAAQPPSVSTVPDV